MGIYVRRSLRAGPFRVNLSSSGIGVSAGVPGFRVGTGPRGNYVSVGAGGVRYRTTLGAGPRRRGAPTAARFGSGQPIATPLAVSDIVMVDTSGVEAQALAPTGPDDLVKQLNAASKRPLLWPWAVVLAIVLAGVSAAVPILAAAVLLFGLLLTVWVGFAERAKRTVIAFYEVSGPTASWFDALIGGWPALSQLGGAWRIAASGAVTTTHGYKVNSGAGALVDRQPIQFTASAPRALTTNVAVPSISGGRSSLHFLPDRVLVALRTCGGCERHAALS